MEVRSAGNMWLIYPLCSHIQEGNCNIDKIFLRKVSQARLALQAGSYCRAKSAGNIFTMRRGDGGITDLGILLPHPPTVLFFAPPPAPLPPLCPPPLSLLSPP